MSPALSEILYWKRRRWAAERILDGFGRDLDQRGPAYMDAEYDWEVATEKHRALVQSAWLNSAFMARRAARTADFAEFDALLSRMKANPIVEATI